MSNEEDSQEEQAPVVELRDIMDGLEAQGMIPEGFVMVYMMGDPAEAEDNTQTDYFFRSFCASRELLHKKTVMVYQDTPITRHEIAWFGSWNQMADVIEATEGEIITNLNRFLQDGSLNQMPRMDFMFVNKTPPVEADEEE